MIQPFEGPAARAFPAAPAPLGRRSRLLPGAAAA